MTRGGHPPFSRHRVATRVAVALVIATLAATTAGCGGGGHDDAAPTVPDPALATTTPSATSAVESATTTSTPAATEAPTTIDAAVPTTPPPSTRTARSVPTTTAPASSPAPTDPRVSLVTAADLGASWHAGCPVGPASLRRVSVTYHGFDGAEHDGALIVHADAVSATLTAFDRLRSARFPIRRVETVDHYGASDDASMAADNTSAFNCRPSTGSSTTWSQHAYGRAIDINPLENPYVSGSSVQPPAGSAYLDRTDVRTGMAVPGGDLVNAFAAVGWGWGGSWTTVKDYQHVSANGR